MKAKLRREILGSKVRMNKESQEPYLPPGWRFRKRGELVGRGDLFVGVQCRWVKTSRAGKLCANWLFYICKDK